VKIKPQSPQAWGVLSRLGKNVNGICSKLSRKGRLEVFGLFPQGKTPKIFLTYAAIYYKYTT
jgi:hypothetical protein